MLSHIPALSRATLVIALAASVGCAGDAVLSPSPALPQTTGTAGALVSFADATLEGFQSGSDTVVAKWVVPANQASVQKLGYHKVSFPAYAICDPATSGYGPAYWDLPCTATRDPITITVRAWMTPDQQVRVSFVPDVRFVPSSDPTRWVTLYMKDRKTQDVSTLGALNILWLPGTGATQAVDESATDASLRTTASPLSGYVWRRVKHFSGYTVAAGRSVADDVSIDVSAF